MMLPNRLETVQLLSAGACPAANVLAVENISASWNFIYDGDGNRVRQEYFEGVFGAAVIVKVTSYFAGGSYELNQSGVVESDNETILISDTITRKYYSFGGQSVAMIECTPQGCAGGLQYFLTDHLGSVVAVTDGSGVLLGQQRYAPFGEVRTIAGSAGISTTDFGYTGQRAISYINLMDYHSRWYDSSLGRFISPDSIIPDGNPQSLNRYSYVGNRPLNATDPTGHRQTECDPGENCGGRNTPLQDLSTNSEDYGLTFEGWSEDSQKAIMREVQLMALKFWTAYWSYLGSMCQTASCIGLKTFSGGAEDLFHAVFGNITWKLTTQDGSCDAGTLECGNFVKNYTEKNGTGAEIHNGLMMHEFFHSFDNRIAGPKYASTLLNDNGRFKRDMTKYRSEGFPDVQHFYGDPNGCGGTTSCEDFGDMGMNWVRNSFASNDSGIAAYDWMDDRMGGWIYMSLHR